MYKIEYLPIAKEDILDIAKYINYTLLNPIAAKNTVKNILESIDNLAEFPYSNRVYRPMRELSYEYRRLIVGNYLVFYWVDEEKKLISVARIIYSRRDYEDLI